LCGRLGRVKVPKFLLEEGLDQEFFKIFFSEFYPIETLDYPFDSFDFIVYRGYSMHFRQLEEGAVEPEYQFVFEKRVQEASETGLKNEVLFDTTISIKEIKEVINHPFVGKRHG